MRYVVTLRHDVEQTLLEHLRDYLVNDVRFGTLYPNFAGVRIDLEHPIALLRDHQINETRLRPDLLPSITIICVMDAKAPVEVAPKLQDIKIGAAEIAHMEAHPELYLMAPEDLVALKSIVQSQEYAWSEGASTLLRASVSIEVWADTIPIKNVLYDLVYAFLMGKKRHELAAEHELKIQDQSISGERSGNYNFDFGKIIYGGALSMSVDYGLSQFFVDTETEELAEIEHYVTEVKHE